MLAANYPRLPVNKTNNYLIFIFRPEMQFYELNFTERLNLLTKKIQDVKKYLKENVEEGKQKSIFIAPEYLFKNFSEKGEKRYYTQQEKNIYMY